MSNDHTSFQGRERRPASPRSNLAIGSGAAERIEIAVIGHTHPDSPEPYDADWLSVEVEVAAGVFAGRFPASFRVGDFVQFRDALARLQKSLLGEAVFDTAEHQLELRLVGNGRGQLALTGAAHHPTDGNTLSFAFALDQTQIVEPLRQLERIITNFPARA